MQKYTYIHYTSMSNSQYNQHHSEIFQLPVYTDKAIHVWSEAQTTVSHKTGSNLYNKNHILVWRFHVLQGREVWLDYVDYIVLLFLLIVSFYLHPHLKYNNLQYMCVHVESCIIAIMLTIGSVQ